MTLLTINERYNFTVYFGTWFLEWNDKLLNYWTKLFTHVYKGIKSTEQVIKVLNLT